MESILVIDNYDSFTFNLVHMLRELSAEDITVWRNDKFAVEDVARFSKIVLSPGPGLPQEAGKMPELIARFAAEKQILGVCLGHQAIAEYCGATLKNLSRVFHGVQSDIIIKDSSDYLFSGLKSSFKAGRYHSWSVSRDNIPDQLIVTAEDSDGEIMAIRHKEFNLRGIQFHPESVMTPCGKDIISNWLNSSSMEI
ncbi:MAG: aminodeoxychorismate/anthranilate synthase component II [Candidatus Dadabacteria bacterium]|nr:MAG: aminodeoxychorismate/anthranilate synthase component II [Candidatus Dadabacteria bacterium]